MTNHYITSQSNVSGDGDPAGDGDTAIITGTSSVGAAIMEVRWSDTATGGSSYVLRRRDLVDWLERVIRFINSNGAAGAAGTDIPVN